MRKNVTPGAAIAFAIATMLGIAHAQDGYPVKPIRIVSPAAGGGSDFVARLLAPKMSEALGQQVIVDNRGAISAEVVAKAAPDGYTLHVNGPPLWVLPMMRPAAWDPLKDFVPVSLAVTSPSILAVHPSLPVKTVKDVIALAKARPGQLNYAAGTIGAAPHLAGELFKSMAGVNIVRVPYKGSGPALIGLMTGEAQIMFPAASGIGYIKQGKIRAIAVGSAEPSPLLPGVPTIAASGLPGYESVSPQGLFAPARTPPAIVNRLSQEVARALSGAEVRERLLASGVQVVASTPEAFAAAMRADIDRTAKLIKSANIKAD
ncbi:MAG TPA: tripartite tricarboxylate transporter substrate-binding protein [Burkholderiales bacterium]|nr:tripartite tricarboxylate transporter substrate-binding protein [Burkholderiales bacterium]